VIFLQTNNQIIKRYK